MRDLLLLLGCIFGSAFASGSETALVSASRIRLERLRSDGRRGAGVALRLLQHRDRALIATLVATNLFNIASGVVATVALWKFFGPSASLVATVLMTCVLLVLAEIVPKAYFRHHAEAMLMGSGAIWEALTWVLTPVVYPLQRFMDAIFRLVGKKPQLIIRSRAEIKLVLEESGEMGRLHQHEQEMLESTLDYAETTAREVMLPIAEVMLLEETARTEELLELVREHGHTRIPVFRERVDQIVGLVNVFDVLYDPDHKQAIRSHVRPARLVPDTKSIDQLFLEMQRQRESLVVVVNEFGACIGIVSTEDILEEIFGELTDEHEDSTPETRQLGVGHYKVSARRDIDDFNEETGWELPKVGYETVGGYVLYRMGRIPRRGESFTDGPLSVRVTDADRYGVREVEFREARGGDGSSSAPD